MSEIFNCVTRQQKKLPSLLRIVEEDCLFHSDAGPMGHPKGEKSSDPCVVLSHSVMSEAMQPHGLQPARLLCP